MISAMEHKAEERVSLPSRLWLGGADCMITTLCNIVTGGGLTFFFVSYFGMDAGWSAACWLLFGVWNAVNDPLFGYISDRTKTKHGRRIPYIRYGAIAIAAVFILTWVIWFGTDSDAQMFAQMLISLFFFDMLYTAIATSVYVMPFEMAVTNEARGKILFVKVLFGLAALSVPLVLLAELENLLNRSLAQFQLLMTGIGAAAGAVIFFSTFFYREKGYVREEQQYPFVKSLAACFKNRSFLIFEIISFSVTYIQTALMIGLSYYFGASGVNYLWCYLAMFAGIVLGMFLWTKPGARWGVKKSVVIMCAVFGGGLLVMLAFGGHTAAGIAGFLCAGIGFSGGMYLIPLMNGDVIDWDEHVSGLRREGMYAGVNSFICKPAISIANALFPIMLGWFGYDTALPAEAQTDLAKFGVRFAWLFVPAALLLVCAVCIRAFYPLAGAQWAEIKARLTARHAEKQAAFEREMLERAAQEKKA